MSADPSVTLRGEPAAVGLPVVLVTIDVGTAGMLVPGACTQRSRGHVLRRVTRLCPTVGLLRRASGHEGPLKSAPYCAEKTARGRLPPTRGPDREEVSPVLRVFTADRDWNSTLVAEVSGLREAESRANEVAQGQLYGAVEDHHGHLVYLAHRAS